MVAGEVGFKIMTSDHVMGQAHSNLMKERNYYVNLALISQKRGDTQSYNRYMDRAINAEKAAFKAAQIVKQKK
ncbi:hypothetical protein ACFOUP_16255 [Belliella kenyensis]|uniref:Uncharacterized protein n=1 Tax=Belliella kenyensis TaxID=1472724 RepID=A0ABV8ENN8_9BACT|nr:hypothetical protein [Belliella kenyensis]MCH7403875.1 hypothetical protein [Belliella kenyensis]MDN3604895.1 hypothetical protein [Belliella kenyensis]